MMFCGHNRALWFLGSPDKWLRAAARLQAFAEVWLAGCLVAGATLKTLHAPGLSSTRIWRSPRSLLRSVGFQVQASGLNSAMSTKSEEAKGSPPAGTVIDHVCEPEPEPEASEHPMQTSIEEESQKTSPSIGGAVVSLL